MDFLDPRKRRASSIRLMTGYALMSIVIILGAYLLVNAASGYSFNTTTGEIIQNGLLFVDSQPGGAKIYLDGKQQGGTTASRLILPEGKYKLSLQKDGYRTWQREFTLAEHSVARYVYPFLFPTDPQSKPLKNYTALPPLLTQSPDRHWLLVELTPTGSTVSFEQLDTTNLNSAPKVLSSPAALLSGGAQAGGTLKEVEWSTDNKNVLLQHDYTGGTEFIVFNRDAPSESFNVNRLLNINPTEVALRDKKIDQLYVFNKTTGEVQVADIKAVTVKPLLSRVLAFKSYGSNLINYVTDQNAIPGQVSARIWDGDKSYLLYSFSAGNNYLIDQAQFQGHFYYVAGSDTDSRINLFKDPLSSVKNPSIAKAIPLLSLNIKGATKVSFSANTRFVEAEAGQSLAVYDIESQTVFHYTLDKPLGEMLHWMDGHRMISTTAGSVFVTDYDSTNQQVLTPSLYNKGGFFDQPFEHMFTVVSSAGGGVSLQSVSLLAGADAPSANQ